MRKFFFPVFLVTVLIASTVYSQGLESPIRVYSQRLETPIKIVHPDLSGTWSLNFGKSEFKDAASKDISDESLTLTLDQKLSVISVKITVRQLTKSETIADFNIYTDGRASEIPIAHTGSSGTAEWNGNKLMLTVFGSPKERDALIVEVELSADGNTLTSTLKGTTTGTAADGRTIRVIDNTKTLTMIYDRVTGTPARLNKTPLPEEK
jgi:hypothetical protein